ncbi:MAG TPA: Imm26 family immunity protein [Geobacteraceae bacterium]
MKLPYEEGSWFAVPLRKPGFAIGVVARATSKGKVLGCYFFGPVRSIVPSLGELEGVRTVDSVAVYMIGDLYLLKGRWPIIGKHKSWDRTKWAMPTFLRQEEFSGRKWKVYYSDTDPNKVEKEELCSECDTTSFPKDSLLGAGVVEVRLTQLLAELGKI